MIDRLSVSLSIILPCFNEGGNIYKTLETILKFCTNNDKINEFEILVVDDGSTDNSVDIITSFTRKYPGVVKLLIHERNKGYGKTLRDGFNLATKDWLFFTDSDGQFDIKDLEKFILNVKKADLIVGKRINRKDSFVRKLNASLFNLMVKVGYRINVADIDCAFKLFKRDLIDLSKISATGALINTELIYLAKSKRARILQLPVNHYERRYGNSTGGNVKVIGRAMKEFLSLRLHLFATQTNFHHFNTWFIGLLSFTVVSFAIYWSFINNAILAYGDAEAHLNIAKRIVDSLTPGMSQMGGVWLPFPHLAMIPFVWNDYLWSTGLAGSLVSGIAFVWTSIILYKLAYLVTKSHFASYIAPIVLITNPNAIYLATTPMSEILLLSTVSSSLYFFIKWVNYNNLSSLILAALFGCLASLSRYDGWFLIVIEVIALIVLSVYKKKSIKNVEGIVIIFSSLAFLGVALWVIWNLLIFGNPLHFADSDYGSKAQQMWFFERGYLPTYKNLPLSALYYMTDTLLVLGNYVFGLFVLGVLVFTSNLIFNIKRGVSAQNLVIFLLLFSFIFYTVSLFTGQASLILPTFAESWYQWSLSNVRYGVQMLLPAGIFITLLGFSLKIDNRFTFDLYNSTRSSYDKARKCDSLQRWSEWVILANNFKRT